MNKMRMFDVYQHDTDTTCVHSFLNGKVFPDVFPKEGFDLGKSLQSVYPLLDIIFSMLPYDDLISCRLVNNYWKEIASIELKKRNKISWVILERLRDCVSAPTTLKASKNFQHSNCSTAIYVYNNKMLQLNKFVCSHTSKAVERKTYKEYIQDDLSSKHLKNYCYLSARNISTPYFTKTKMKGESMNMILAVFLSNIPGIRVKMFKCPPQNIKREIKFELKSNESFRCIIPFTFSHRTTETAIAKLLSFVTAYTMNGQKLAMGGGLLDSVTMNINDRIYRKKDVCFIGFLQDITATNCTFEAYSVVLWECDEIHLRSSLEEFKNQIKFKAQSVLFKFNCCDKDNKDIEDEILKDYFESSVLIGMDVNGEIGINNVDVKPELDLGNKFYHSFTTILLLITW